MAELEKKVRQEVEKITDPKTGLTFGQMKMITDIKKQEFGVIKIDFIPSSPFCPIAFKLALDIRNAAKKVNGVKKALVYCHGHAMEKAINQSVNKEENAE